MIMHLCPGELPFIHILDEFSKGPEYVDYVRRSGVATSQINRRVSASSRI